MSNKYTNINNAIFYLVGDTRMLNYLLYVYHLPLKPEIRPVGLVMEAMDLHSSILN
jgi:hypothetical protein